MSPLSFISGFSAPVRAILFIVGHPSLWPFVLAPIIVNIIVVTVTWEFAGRYIDGWMVGRWQGEAWYMDWLRYMAVGLGYVLRFLVTVVSFVVIASLANLPFNDLLSERVEKIRKTFEDNLPFSPARFFRQLGVTAAQESKRVLIYMSLATVILILSFTPLAPIAIVANLLLSAMFVATDYLSYPLERRGVWLIKKKMAFVRENAAPCIGFGLSLALLLIIPLLNLLMLPLVLPLWVVGGTLLFGDMARSNPNLVAPDKILAELSPQTQISVPETISVPPPPPPV